MTKDKKSVKILDKKENNSYKALKTTKILCNKEFQLIEGKEIPKGIDEAFINSLKNSNLIK